MLAKPRTDAQRNRQRLLDAAIVAFADGAGDAVALETIARNAGVGIGTLYRHFPTREALVEAVYRTELAEVCATAPELLTRYPPEVALRRWMDRYADYVITKRGMAETLREVFASGALAAGETRAAVTDAVGTLLAAGVAAGVIRADVRADDVTATLVGIFLATPRLEQREQAGRMLDLVAEGLRAH